MPQCRWVGNLGPSASATLTVTGLVEIASVFTNTAQVNASGTADPDSTPGNNIEIEDDQGSVIVTALTPFGAWADQFNLPPGQKGPDADGDGMANLEEWIAGTDPRYPSDVLEIIQAAY